MVADGDGRELEIQLPQIDFLGLDVVREDLRIIAGIEQDAPFDIYRLGGNPQSFFIVEVLPNAS